MRLAKLALGLSLLALVTIAPRLAHADGVVTNGDFSSPGSLTGWNSNDWFQDSSGSYNFASTGCVGPNCLQGGAYPAFLSQDLSTTPNESYTLNFSYAAGFWYPSELQVFFGGNLVDDLVNLQTTSLNSYTVSGLVATSSTTTLEFFGRQDPDYDQLTNISVTDDGPTSASPVPEPGTIGMVGTGVLGLLGAVRRKFSV